MALPVMGFSQEEMWDKISSGHEPPQIKWFKDAKFGIFIHWGLYSQLGGVWKGRRYYGSGEWIMSQGKIPAAEYAGVAASFNPSHFDAGKWAGLASEAGARYLVITAKHHEGFSMFDSRVSDFSIVKATPYRRDPMKELAAATRRRGIQFGFYYSQFLDWHEPNGGGNKWDFDETKKDYGQYYREKSIPQLKELMTNYGPLGIVWFDMPGGLTKDQTRQLVDSLRLLQPRCLFSSRVGQGLGDYKDFGDSEIPPAPIAGAWESIYTHNDSWGYISHDMDFKSSGEVIQLLARVASRGGNLMLNIGPDGNGDIPAYSEKCLRATGAWLRLNGESIYGTTAGFIPAQPWGVTTAKPGRLYLQVLKRPADGRLLVPGFSATVDKVYGLAGGRPVAWHKEGSDLYVDVPAGSAAVTVYAVDYHGAVPSYDTTAAVMVSAQYEENDIEAVRAKVSGNAGIKSITHSNYYGDWKHTTCVIGMKEPQDTAVFSLRVTSPGDYRIILEYACSGQTKQEGVIGLDGKDYFFQALYTGEYNSHRPLLFIRQAVTICTVPTPGVYRLTIHPVQSGTELFSLKSVILVPVPADGGPATAGPALRLPALFSDNMVLEQQSGAAIWGWAQPGATVSVMGSWNGKDVAAVTDAGGKWNVSLPTAKAGGPYNIRVRAGGPDSLVVRGIWLGEVWLASGQSNMNYPIARLASWRKGVDDYQQEVAGARDSLIRMFTVEQAVASTPQDDVKGAWQVCSPSTAGNFSAVAYYFAREIRKRTGFPVGIIHSSVGGTPAEAWTKKEVLDTLSLAQPAGEPAAGSKAPSALYNGMIHPLAPFTIKGILWYQGESNSDRFLEYRRLLPALIASWRADWRDMLPFYFVQIAPQYSKVPGIREAQLFTYKKVPRTGMVVLTDAGDSLNIHPTNKKIVGQRLALWALAKDYGKRELVYSGPLYKSMSVAGDSVRLRFDFADGGLRAGVFGQATGKGELSEFTIAGADSVFVPARAVIDRNTVVVFSGKVKRPQAVRFAWKNFPRPDLYNAAGLPASPFRTDDWPL